MVGAYLITLLLVIPPLLIGKRYKNKKNSFIIWYIIFVFVFITGFRDNASISMQLMRQSDEANYRRAFDLLINTPFSISNINSYEWGRYIIDWVLANTFKNSQAWVFFYSVLTNIIFVKMIRKYVQPFWFGVFLYITIGVYTFQMNGTANTLAAAILLLGIDFIIRNQFIKYFLIVAVAASIHFSSWLMLPLYFVLTKKKFTKATPAWLLFSVMFMLTFNDIANFVLPRTPYANYLNWINSSQSYGVSFQRVIIFSIVYMFVLIFKNKIKEFNQYDRYFTNGIIALIFINIVSLSYVFVHRLEVLLLFSAIYCIPRVVYSFKSPIRYLLIAVFFIGFIGFGIQQNWSVLYNNIVYGNL